MSATLIRGDRGPTIAGLATNNVRRTGGEMQGHHSSALRRWFLNGAIAQTSLAGAAG